MKSVALGFVIYDEIDFLPTFLSSLEEQIHLLSEVIVVDNNPHQIATALLRQHPIYQKHENLFSIFPGLTNNIAAARAAIVSRVKSDLLAFTDPDCILPKSWLQELIENYNILEAQFEKKSGSSLLAEEVRSKKKSDFCQPIFGVGGSSQLPEDEGLYSCLNGVLSSYLGAGQSPQGQRSSSSRGFASVDHLPTTNCLLNKEIVLALGNFNENHKTAGEDLALGLRARARDFQMAQFHSPRVVNRSCNSLRSWALRMFRFGQAQSYLQILIKRHDFRVLFGLFILAIFIVMSMNFFVAIAAYFLIIFFESLHISFKKQLSIRKVPLLILCFWTTHFFYLLGFLFGLIKNFTSLNFFRKI